LEDCDDENAETYPGATEVPYNGIDDDCDSMTLDDDLDQDGFVLSEDCDDENAELNPAAIEIPNNGIDEDCDGEDLIMTSLDELELLNITISPNPTKGKLNIILSNSVSASVFIKDITGKIIIQSEINSSGEIDLEDLSNGIYILWIQTKKSYCIERVMKMSPS